jgi:hypothetical protein
MSKDSLLANKQMNIYGQISSIYANNWFHGNISRSQAYSLLVSNSNNESGRFLIRYSSDYTGTYTLCLCKSGKVYNYKIYNQNGLFFITNKNKFDNLNDLIEFYKKNSAGSNFFTFKENGFFNCLIYLNERSYLHIRNSSSTLK